MRPLAALLARVIVEPRWDILIYTVPSQPSRKRAAVWRELKKVGAVYLRDGVAVLPAGSGTIEALRRIVALVEGFAGQATVVATADFDASRSAALRAQIATERAAEYAEVVREAEGLLAHLRREAAHRAFTRAERAALERDLGKLTRWAAQIRARDYLAAAEPRALTEVLARCGRALHALPDTGNAPAT